MNQNVPMKLQVLTDDGYPYVGFCKTKLAALGSLRRQLGQYAMRRVFYLPEDITAIITSCDTCDIITIMGGTPRGFLFHPRCGQILLGYAAQNHEHYVNGGGWDFDGNAIGAEGFFPLADDDHGTRFISASKRGGPWKYTVRTPENYGNIDWKGDAPGVKKSEITVLTWRGSASRYWGAGMDSTIRSSNVYSGGELLFSLMGYEVYGAALTKDADGKLWQIGVTADSGIINVYAQPHQSAEYNFLYDEEDHPDGWRLLGTMNANKEENLSTTFNAFFFNGSGTEANSCTTNYVRLSGYQLVYGTEYNYYTITINIDEKTAIIVETSEDDNVEEVTATNDNPPDPPTEDWRDPTTNEPVTPTAPMSFLFVGTSAQSCQASISATRTRTISAVAIDYVGDEKVVMSMEISKETLLNADIDIYNEYHKVALENGFRVEGSGYTDNSCTLTIKETVKLLLNGDEYLLTDYSYTNSSTSVSEYGAYQGWNSESGYYIDTYEGSNEDNSERTLEYKYSSIVFADVRNSIISTLTVDREVSQTRNRSGSFSEDPPANTSQTTDSPTTDDIVGCALKIYGDVVSNLNFYEGTKAFDAYIGTISLPIHTYTYAGTLEANVAYFNNFGASAAFIVGGATGSFAVDVHGNHFYSIVYNAGVFSHLTGCDNVAELTQTPDPNQAYHPIAPL